MSTMRIDAIRVVDRHRRDLGSIAGLRESIASVGLLHPIVVNADGRLVAGERRLVACTQLGWTEIPVTVAESMESAAALLAAERDENTCRLDMAPSEKVALGLALEALGRRPARRPAKSENFTEFQKGDTRHQVGAAVGMSGPTYDRAKAVVKRAETGDALAQEALEEMDRSGKVTPAYEKVTGRPTEGRQITALRENGASNTFAIQTERDEQRAQAHRRKVVDLVSTLTGFARGLDAIDVNRARAVMDEAELREWDRSLGDSLSKLRGFRSELQKGRP